MQENTTNRNRMALRTRAGLAVCGLFAAASFLACGDEAPAAGSSTSNEDDSAAAYAALSSNLEACEDQLDDCTTAAAGDATKKAACDAAAMSCNQKAQGAEDHAKSCLKHDADRCKKDKDADAGPGDAGAGEVHSCIDKHAPKLPMCVKDMLTCLDDAGVRKGDATPKEIGECLKDAHDCFKAELAKKREEARAERKAREQQKHAAAGSVSMPMAGSPAKDAAGGPAKAEAGSGEAGAGGQKAAPVRPSILPPFWHH